MSIWKKNASIAQLTERGKNTMSEFLEMEFLELGPDYLLAKMPVTDKTRQPYGQLHGGASAAFAETLGSICGSLCVDENQAIVGLELNINHIKSKKDGFVFGTSKPIHIGKSTQVWQIEIKDESDKLVSISRLTIMTLNLK